MRPDSRCPRVIGLGIACLDHLFLAEPAPPGGQARLLDYVIEGGGLVATALVAAARLGARAEIRTWLGDDTEGELVVAGLRAEGVGVAGATIVAGARTPASFIHVVPSSGERTIYHRRGLEAFSDQVAAAMDDDVVCDAALVDGVWPEASRAFARRARDRSIPVVGDFCPDGKLRELGGIVTDLIVSRPCAERLTPDGSWTTRLTYLASLGPEFAAITAGPEGCWYLEAGEACHRPALSVAVVDTTGAGDVFHGAYAYGLGRGWSRPRCIEFAAAVAALSCRSLGGRKAIPTLDEALRFLGENGSNEWA